MNNSIEAQRKQIIFASIGVMLALPFPILIIILWVTLDSIKGQATGLGEGAMNAVFLYLLQFFVVPVLSIGSLIISSIVTMKGAMVAKRIGYAAFAVTGIGFILLGLFLNNN